MSLKGGSFSMNGRSAKMLDLIAAILFVLALGLLAVGLDSEKESILYLVTGGVCSVASIIVALIALRAPRPLLGPPSKIKSAKTL
jgi:hypothetical protein